MLNRRLPLLFFVPLLFLLACDAVMAHPNTSAPRTRDLGEYTRACDERRDAIDDWERKQERKVEDEWIEGRRGLLQTGVKARRIGEEAQSMRQELRDNCEANKPSPEIAAKRLGIPGCINADALRNILAEFRADAAKTGAAVHRPAAMRPGGSHRRLGGHGVGHVHGVRGRMDEVSYPVPHGERKVGGVGELRQQRPNC